MCSTPRPRRIAKVKSTPRVVSIMVSMDEDARHRFTARANQVAERKEAERKKNEDQQLLKSQKEKQQQSLKIKQKNKSISYWLFSASFAELFKKLVTGH